MPAFKPIAAGSRYARLAVLVDRELGSKQLHCRCDCGKLVVLHAHLWGKQHSCGCWRDEAVARHQTTHGLARTREYKTWVSMINRCTNPKADQWPNYGGRGISVCERWLDVENFYADMAPRPAGMTIDRIDVNGNYEPGNVRWATPAQQRANQRERRPATHCRRGLHELTPDNTWHAGTRRMCKACRQQYLRTRASVPQLDAPAKP